MKNSYATLLILFSVISYGQIINFPDANFKAKLLVPGTAKDINGNVVIVDGNSDGEIEVSEVQPVEILNLASSNISDLTGISYFTNLKSLRCSNNLLQTIVIDHSIALWGLDADHNALTLVDVHFGGYELPGLDLSYNNLTSFTLEPLTLATYEGVNLSHNQLTDLTLGGSMESLNVSFNNLTTVGGSAYIMRDVNFRNNQFSLLDLTNITFGYQSHVALGNNIVDTVLFGDSPGNIDYSTNNTFLDLGNFSGYVTCYPEETGNITISNCPNLNYFTLKNGIYHGYRTCNEGGDIFQIRSMDLSITNCPNLSFICVDEGNEQAVVQSEINQLGLQNQVQVNTYCTFTPGGIYYTVNGTTKLDVDANGCDANDPVIPFQKFLITNGTQSQVISANNMGDYEINVGQGSHTIAPILENPEYYTVSPAALILNFPTDMSPTNQQFCIAANQSHADLEVSVLPVGIARPGFDATYKISYKNKGTQSQSGTISFAYDDAVLDFMNANPTVTSQTSNTLYWNFTDLLPFETRSTLVTLNANTPMEIPPLNGGDVLNFTASINSTSLDETPNDNTFALNQTVVNSFDPNDKTCLEGNVITPEMAGKYVHYMIRFENTGTANAESIVVKDMVDIEKFDISSLIPIDGSHPFVTRISNTNKVEFIFENINLPFDDANNDGYVAFKIKTKPTLALGDTFSNTASIYLDYNFPIITNTATTAVALLANSDFDFGDYFKIYPNPVNDILNIEMKKTIEVTSINIYNTLGQLVLVIPNAQQTKSVDVSSLRIGNYLMEINSDKGSSSVKLVKQ